MASALNLKRILCGVALACCPLFFSSCDTPSSDIANPFAKKVSTRIVLSPNSSGEDIRYVYMAEDGITKTMTQIEYKNGVTSYSFHRSDGTIKEIKEFYPPARGETQRQLKLHASLNSDGKDFLSRTTYRQDGSLEAQGERIGEGRYQTRWFFEDGATLNKLLFYDSERRLLSKDEYRKDGSVESQSRRVGSSELVSKYYSQSGTLTHEFSESRLNVLSGVFYNEDGSVRIRFMDSGWKLNSQYFDKSELVLEVEYFKDSMEVTSYAGGKPLHKQVWSRLGNKGEECTAAYKLFKVEGAWQSSDQRTYTRLTIEMNEEGTAAQWVEKVTVVYSSSSLGGEQQNLRTRTVKLLRPDGSVAIVKNYNEDILLSERGGTGADHIDISTLLSKPIFECLRIPRKAERYRAHSNFT